jgi:hypothetical protein
MKNRGYTCQIRKITPWMSLIFTPGCEPSIPQGTQKTGGLPHVAVSRYDSIISLSGAGAGIAAFNVNQ